VSFAYPAVLLLLAVPLALVVWVMRRSGTRVVLPLDHAARHTGNWLRFPIGLAEMLPALLLAVVVLVLAGPQQLGAPRTKRRLTNIEFCVDVSGSMTAPFADGTRYDASMAAINEFLDFRKGDAFGLTFFGNNFLHWVPLTSDPSAIRCSVPFMRPEIAPPWFGGTEIAKALMACRAVLTERDEGDRMIVLVSDGYSSDLDNGNDIELAETLKRDQIAVFAIHVGGGDIPDPIVNITRLTGGEVFEPGDTESLRYVFHRIDEMRRAPLEKTAAESQDHFFPYCVAGLGVLGLSTLCSFGLRYTPW
jgi:Ca-activated chloride channel family protein